MGCPKLTYRLNADPFLRCVYSAEDEGCDYSGQLKKYTLANSSRPYQMTGQIYFPSTMDTDLRTTTYTSGERPASISKSGKTATFAYNHAGERTKMEVKTGSTVNYTRTYLGGNYEHELSGGIPSERLYLGGTPYDAPAVAIRSNSGAWVLHYIHRDYLGSIVAVTNTNTTNTAVETNSYDAWGRLRNPANLQPYAHNATQQFALLLKRGYTGHEHLPEFGLIYMNARLYDPVIGRFLSPDPFVQAPEFSQSFNRQSYCLNNPLIYTDPSGEFFWTLVTTVFDFGRTLFFKGGLDLSNFKSMGNAWKEFDPTASWSRTNKAWQIDKTFFSNKIDWVSFMGYMGAGGLNIAGKVESVTRYGGATVIETNYGWKKGSGVTLGNFILGEKGIKADPNNSLFQHEYGHYLQYKELGSKQYIRKVGLPSLFAPAKGHAFQSFEQDANRRAFLYFNEHEPDFYQKEMEYIANLGHFNPNEHEFRGWNFSKNPLDIYNNRGILDSSGDNGYNYRDYRDPDPRVRALIDNLKIKPYCYYRGKHIQIWSY